MGAKVLLPADGDSFDFGGLGVHWKVDGGDTGQRFSIVHHPLAPRALAAPLHYHHNEDELSMGALRGPDEFVRAGPNAFVVRRRPAMETARRYLSHYPSHLAAYLALQCALMQRYVRRGGTAQDFCSHLAPVYRRKYRPIFFGPVLDAAGGPSPGEE
jgi:hypothetical protein